MTNSLLILLTLLITIAYFAGRKIMAAIQRKKRPNIIGLFELRQPLVNGFKLLIKKTLLPFKIKKTFFFTFPLFSGKLFEKLNLNSFVKTPSNLLNINVVLNKQMFINIFANYSSWPLTWYCLLIILMIFLISIYQLIKTKQFKMLINKIVLLFFIKTSLFSNKCNCSSQNWKAFIKLLIIFFDHFVWWVFKAGPELALTAVFVLCFNQMLLRLGIIDSYTSDKNLYYLFIKNSIPRLEGNLPLFFLSLVYSRFLIRILNSIRYCGWSFFANAYFLIKRFIKALRFFLNKNQNESFWFKTYFILEFTRRAFNSIDNKYNFAPSVLESPGFCFSFIICYSFAWCLYFFFFI